MALRYVYNKQPVAEGARDLFIVDGRNFIRTGLLGTKTGIEPMAVTYRLREVYDDAVAKINHAPVGIDSRTTIEVKK